MCICASSARDEQPPDLCCGLQSSYCLGSAEDLHHHKRKEAIVASREDRSRRGALPLSR
jgi:hypothetical protein